VVERFRQEVKLARRVTHRNVVRTFDVGAHGDGRFVTLELIEGESLAARLAREGRMPVTHVLAIARELAEGLAAAHAAGVLHLDLKPENVLVERARGAVSGEPAGGARLPPGVKRVVVTDFGIARAAEAVGPLGFAGTPAYMAPEQVEGADHIDPRADVYAFGALLFELLTGQSAWSGGSALAIATARLNGPAPDARARRPELPAALGDAVRRMMARHPDDRPRDGAALAEVLDALIGAEARPAGDSEPPDSPRWRAQQIAPTAHADRAVAVLPVRVVPDDAVLADELTEDLIDRLSMTRGLRVRHHGATRAAAAAGDEARAVGQRLAVDVVVEVTVRRGEATTRLSARAIGVADGFQLWAQRFESAPGELLTLNDRVAHAVAEALSRGAAGATRAPLADPRALERYVAARNALRLAWTGFRPFAPVLAMFEEARALAPDDPMILSGAAMARARAANYHQATATARDEARALAEQALRLAPGATEPWFARATLAHVEGRWPEAVTDLRRALATNGAYLPGQSLLAAIQGEVGPLDDAILRFDVVAELDPTSRYAALIQSQLHMLAGRTAAALRAFPRADDPDSAMALSIAAARTNLWLGDAHVPVAEPPPGAPSLLAVRALRRALAGDHAAADGLDDELRRVPAGTRFRFIVLQLAAEIYAALERRDDALALIEEAGATGLYDAMWLAGCPLLAPLRGDPRFVAASALVEARAAEVRAALTRPL